MHLLYLDESGDPAWPKPYGKSRNRWFVLTGLSLEESQWKNINDQFILILNKYFKSYNSFELKYSALTTKYGVPPYDQLKDIEKLHLADDIFNLILSIKPILFAIAIDKLKHKQMYENRAHWPKLLAMRFIAPRFHKYLERINGYGIFVMDEEERKSDKKLKEIIGKSREVGIVLQTPFDPFRTDTRLSRIIESVLFLPSEDSPGISLTDFCSHSIWLHFERGLNKRFNQIKHLFDNDKGTIYGLKIWPS